MKQNIRK